MNIGGGEVAGHLVQLLDAAVLAEPDGAAAEVLGAGAQEVVVSRVEEHPDAVRHYGSRPVCRVSFMGARQKIC